MTVVLCTWESHTFHVSAPPHLAEPGLGRVMGLPSKASTHLPVWTQRGPAEAGLRVGGGGTAGRLRWGCDHGASFCCLISCCECALGRTRAEVSMWEGLAPRSTGADGSSRGPGAAPQLRDLVGGRAWWALKPPWDRRPASQEPLSSGIRGRVSEAEIFKRARHLISMSQETKPVRQSYSGEWGGGLTGDPGPGDPTTALVQAVLTLGLQ